MVVVRDPGTHPAQCAHYSSCWSKVEIERNEVRHGSSKKKLPMISIDEESFLSIQSKSGCDEKASLHLKMCVFC